MKKYLLLLTFLLSGSMIQAIDFSPRAISVYNHLFTLYFDSAQVAFDELKVREPNNRIDGYLSHTRLFLDLFTSEDPKVFEERKDEFETYLYRVRQEANRNPTSYYCEAEMLLQEASIYAKFGETFTAGRRALAAYEVAEVLNEEHPEFGPGTFLLGLVEVGLGSLPGSYRWIIGVFGYNGDISQGLEHIKSGYAASVTAYPHFTVPFAFTNGYAVYQLGLKPDLRISQLGVNSHQSILLLFLESSLLISQSHNAEALKLLEQRPVEGVLDFPYLHYMEGRARLSVFDEDCLKNFDKYLETYKGKHYIKSTYRYLLWADQIWNEGRSSWQYRDWIKNRGSQYMGADKQAILELNEPLTLPLLKARLAFDSGDYDLAMKHLENTNMKEAEWYSKVEYAYRKGRVFEGKKDYKSAAQWYLKALSENAQRDTYQGASASIHLGLLNENQFKDNQKAASFYSLGMSFSGYPYYPGMYRRAKAGYERNSD